MQNKAAIVTLERMVITLALGAMLADVAWILFN